MEQAHQQDHKRHVHAGTPRRPWHGIALADQFVPLVTEHHQGTYNTPPGEEGRGGGTGPAVVKARELLVQCPHRHSHTDRTLDSLNNVDRPFSGHISVTLVQYPPRVGSDTRKEWWVGFRNNMRCPCGIRTRMTMMNGLDSTPSVHRGRRERGYVYSMLHSYLCQ